MRAKRLKTVTLMFSVLFWQKECWAQEQANNNAHNNSLRDRALDQCSRGCNLLCETYGKQCLILMGICACAYLGSSYIKPASSNIHYSNGTIILPPTSKPYGQTRKSSYNLSAQGALLNLRKLRVKLMHPHQTSNNRHKKRQSNGK